MSKICGYSCEHNKSGVCQISVCDKRTIMSDKTEAQMFTRYIDTTITKLQQENKQLKDELKSKPDAQITLQDDKGNKFMVIQTERIDMQVELNKTIEKLFNNWNKLKEYLHNQIPTDKTVLTKHIKIFEVLDKMQEIEQESDSNDSN